MSKDEVGTADRIPVETQISDKPEVNLARRRALVQAGWAVPAILAIGFPRNVEAITRYSETPVGEFTNESDADDRVRQCADEGLVCVTRQRTEMREVTIFTVVDP